ncbi:hypothetical protein NDU88_002054 [Pleurodeles waltl]|uniref:Uncharacterized protein n=1 Tax=Pleurodeles waltl TaxID=8319 RepID=A0AAV7LEM4_PLEWA|nr:hypothetical protein NDU88_002054 [Pleurodeles waltl]
MRVGSKFDYFIAGLIKIIAIGYKKELKMNIDNSLEEPRPDAAPGKRRGTSARAVPVLRLVLAGFSQSRQLAVLLEGQVTDGILLASRRAHPLHGSTEEGDVRYSEGK